MAARTPIETLLQQRTRFRNLVHVPSCTSTQDLAAAEPEADDAIFRADHQTRGRGRQQREWHDEPGADLAVTFRVRVALPRPLALAAALPVAMLQAIEPVLGRPVRLKWPNDLYVDGRKLSGVLVDAGVPSPDSFLIGIGVNGNRTRFPRDLEATATSLALVTGHVVDLDALLLALAERIEAMLVDLQARAHARLEAVFRERLGLVGKAVTIDVGREHTGTLVAIDFEQLHLDGERTFPLGLVRAIRAR